MPTLDHRPSAEPPTRRHPSYSTARPPVTDFRDEFTRLEEGVDRYRLLLLVKKVGTAGGFTPRMIQLLDYYMAFTRDVDWEEGARPVVYQGLSRTALDLGVTERQIQKLEKALAEVGALSWHSSGNHRRYGQRCAKTGRILFAFGVDLSPLAELAPQLEAQLAEKQLYDGAWLETKRQISWYRGRLRERLAALAEEGADATFVAAFDERYREVAVKVRTHMNLPQLRALLARHRGLHEEVGATLAVDEQVGSNDAPSGRTAERASTLDRSPRDVQEFVPNETTNQESFDESNTRRADACYQGSSGGGTVPTSLAVSAGLDRITLGMAIGAASQRLRELLPLQPTWPEIVEVAYRLRPELGISQESWGEACELLGRRGAALCLIVTDRATNRGMGAVRQPAAYFKGLVKRAGRGELRLHASVSGAVRAQLSAEISLTAINSFCQGSGLLRHILPLPCASLWIVNRSKLAQSDCGPARLRRESRKMAGSRK